jgi:DNA-directed RNA polymerase III subunit RPC3
LLTKAYKIIVNLQQRKVEELQQRSRLLEKMNRKDVIANMDLLNEIDKAEVGNMNKIIERIEVSKARLDEMAMILRDF